MDAEEGTPSSARSTIGAGREDPPTDWGDLRERAIVESATKILTERATSRVSVAEIARGAGLSRPSVYFYFDSKQDIVDAALARVAQRMTAPAVRLAADPEVTFEKAADILVGEVISTWRAHRGLIIAAEEIAHQESDAREAWRGAVVTAARALTAIVERDRANGVLPAMGGDTDQQVQAVAWMIERCCYMLFTRDHTSGEEERLQSTLTHLFTRAFGLHDRTGPTAPEP